jgi:hypothetical protein
MGGEGHIAGMISRIRENKKLLQPSKGRRMQDPYALFCENCLPDMAVEQSTQFGRSCLFSQ